MQVHLVRQRFRRNVHGNREFRVCVRGDRLPWPRRTTVPPAFDMWQRTLPGAARSCQRTRRMRRSRSAGLRVRQNVLRRKACRVAGQCNNVVRVRRHAGIGGRRGHRSRSPTSMQRSRRRPAAGWCRLQRQSSRALNFASQRHDLMRGIAPATGELVVRNDGCFAVELDRLAVELVLGAAIVRSAYLQRVPLAAGGSRELFIRQSLTVAQASHAKRTPEDQLHVTLQVHAEFNSKINPYAKHTDQLSAITPFINIANGGPAASELTAFGSR
jgi:hypothetical protein